MTEPGAVTQFRLMLLACASVTTAGIPSGRLYYPNAVSASDDSTAIATLPYAVLAEERHDRTPFAGPGVLGLPSGTLSATFYFSAGTGAIEDFGRNVCSELQTQMSGLPIRSASVGVSGEPDPGSLAASTVETNAGQEVITVTVEWGLTG